MSPQIAALGPYAAVVIADHLCPFTVPVSQQTELFPLPVLAASPSLPTEGTPVTLTCETTLHLQRSDTELQYCFLREGLGQIIKYSLITMCDLAVCQQASCLQMLICWDCNTPRSDIVLQLMGANEVQEKGRKQRVSIANVSLETQTPGGQVIEGGKLVFLYLVSGTTGTITFSWHREDTKNNMGKKTQNSLSAELEILVVKESDAGKYDCRADDSHGSIQSEVNITIGRELHYHSS
ncbi:PREDICTED: LOW QUALITY PROTEIN: Fc receptor-like 2 [Chrysochloris asiatica]|uniref:LOW QUALITY PROTEIN: Fc receptor-like 2 n=1 Tax=Chrysochloris asiatica TaxID=185453 RepID=A0A9B0X4K0_CHRAS|nr:PREDICTED: LOW QUALITY PROTEIN: Fc receptor-like 2 [Chrysochloris asiatica]